MYYPIMKMFVILILHHRNTEKECDGRKDCNNMIRFENVNKTFTLKDSEIHAVQDMSFTVNRGDIFGIIGLSGAGKSTLVRCMNLLEKPTSGKVFLGENELTAMSSKELRLTRKKIGMIFQQFNLLEQRSALKNVCYPLEIIGVSKKEAREKAMKLLELVGLEDRINSYPSQLSGGQKQRVAIARALATNPEVLLCDEATSALDPNTTKATLDLLKKINVELGVTIVIITHEMKIVEQICNNVAIIDDGKIAELGSVQEVFLHPKTKIAKELIAPKNQLLHAMPGGKVLRLSFAEAEFTEPIVAHLIMKCQAAVKIWGASSENIGGKSFGQMFIQLPEDSEIMSEVKAYLNEVHVYYEEVEIDGI